MATDSATPSSDIQKAKSAGNSSAPKTPRSRADTAQKPSSASPPAKRASVLDRVSTRRSLFEYLSSTEGRIAILVYFISTVVHALVLVLLAVMLIDPQAMDDIVQIFSEKPPEKLEVEDLYQAVEQPDQIHNDSFESDPQNDVASSIVEETQPLNLDINDLEPAITIEDEAFESVADIAEAGEFGGRTAKGRKALVEAEGGNAASEAAVVRALKWIADVQQRDGSWNFAEIGNSADAGQFDKCQMGSTGLALMAFLGAGHTHKKEGPYRKAVERGLLYLMNSARIVPAGADFRAPSNQGNMYVQGIAVIALAEAYGMSKDVPLRRAAEQGLRFIVNAQNPSGGGWRYKPQQEGDTSVVGWQLMALVSGNGAGIRVPRGVLNGATKFLDRVQFDEGARYGYNKPGGGSPAVTAVGLLCRMYLGWKADHESLKRGVLYLAKVGPSKNNAYYNYYATQVMHHIGGEAWKQWNNVMRDQLIATQVKDGPEGGSWTPGGPHSQPGGRLYETCLNVMTLEVYYRHLPLYQRNAVQADF